MDEEEILNNMKFTDIMADNLINQPWLMNYELEPIIFDDSGIPGTVYSETWEEDGEHYVTPTIMDLEGKGTLKYYGKDGPGYEVARGKGWGIPFSTQGEANDFANWLHEYHQLTGKTQTSYELGR